MTKVFIFIPQVKIVGGTELSLYEIHNQLKDIVPSVCPVKHFDSRESLLNELKNLSSDSVAAIIMSYKDLCPLIARASLESCGRIKLFCKLYDPHVRQLQASLLSRLAFNLFGSMALETISHWLMGTFLDRNRYVNSVLSQLHKGGGISVYPAESYVADTFKMPELLRGKYQLPPLQLESKVYLNKNDSCKSKQDATQFFFIGRLEGWKGRIAYEVAKILMARSDPSRPFTFHIVGTGPWSENIDILSKSQQSSCKICTYGALYSDDLNSFFESMALSCAVYIGTGVAALQASAHRFPVIKVSIPDTRFFHQLTFGTLNVTDGDLGVFTSDSHRYGYSSFDDIIKRIRSSEIEEILDAQDKFRASFNMNEFYSNVLNHIAAKI